MISDCSAIILAGGNSQRMGQDKALMQVDGKVIIGGDALTIITGDEVYYTTGHTFFAIGLQRID